jgi:DUF917 family protein
VQTTKLIFLIIPILLSGCAAAPIMLTGIGIGSVAVNETTGRTVTDHAVSAANGQDCRLGRALKQQQVCQADGIVKLQVTTTGVQPSSIQEIELKYR